jgi:hypothetical protein
VKDRTLRLAALRASVRGLSRFLPVHLIRTADLLLLLDEVATLQSRDLGSRKGTVTLRCPRCQAVAVLHVGETALFSHAMERCRAALLVESVNPPRRRAVR